MVLRGLVSDEERSKGSHRDHDHCHSSFGLEPEYSPRSVNLTIADVATSYPDYRGYHRENTKTQNPPKCKFLPQANLDIPEKGYRNGYDFYQVNRKSKTFLGIGVLRKASVHTSKITLAFRIPFSRARAAGVTHLTTGNQYGFLEG